MARRQEWLASAETHGEADSVGSPDVACSSFVDKYGIDLNVFKMLLGRKPHVDFKKCLRIAEWTGEGGIHTIGWAKFAFWFWGGCG